MTTRNLSPLRKRDQEGIRAALVAAYPDARFAPCGPMTVYATMTHSRGLRSAVALTPGVFVVEWTTERGSLSPAFAARVGPVNRLTRRHASARRDDFDGVLACLAEGARMAADGTAYE